MPMSSRLPRSLVSSIVFVQLCGLAGCATDAKPEEPSGSIPPSFTSDAGAIVTGSPDTLDLMTWNIERFPKMGDTTIEQVSDDIRRLGVDLIALQEMNDTDALPKLIARLPGWKTELTYEYHGDTEFYNPPVAIIYDTTAITVTQRDIWFPHSEIPFPRPPLALDITWKGHSLTVVNVHLKALGDDIIDTSNPYDEEVRRRDACIKLEERLRIGYDGKPVVVLGDMNDRIDEPPSTNVFEAFLKRPERYRFATMKLATQVIYATASYPKGPSQLDHILVTSPLFNDLEGPKSDIHTLALDRWMTNGWLEYEGVVSDHRPVLLRLSFADASSDAGADGADDVTVDDSSLEETSTDTSDDLDAGSGQPDSADGIPFD